MTEAKNKGARPLRLHARCVVCMRNAGDDAMPFDIKGYRGHPRHHVEICAGCVREITEAGVTRNLSAVFPGLADQARRDVPR